MLDSGLRNGKVEASYDLMVRVNKIKTITLFFGYTAIDLY